MADDQYLIPSPAKPEETQLATHPKEQGRTNIAIGIACLAAVFTLFQAYEAHRARLDAKTAADAQAKDVERSRKAAEDSATAANRGADAAWNSVTQLGNLVATGRAQLKSSERMFEIEQLPSVGLTSLSFESFTDKSPRMDPSKPTVIKIGIVNGGKPAFGCQIRLGGIFDNPTDRFEYPPGIVFLGILDLATGSQVTIPIKVQPPLSLSPASGNVRLYLYGRVDCSTTMTRKPYRTSWCSFFPVSRTGDVVDFLKGCSEGDPARVHR
jgi:hypothetical protein